MIANSLKITQKDFDAFMHLLNNFDFYYTYSDDAGVYRAGKDCEERIDSLCKNNPTLKDIYAHWVVIKTSKEADSISTSQECIESIKQIYVEAVNSESQANINAILQTSPTTTAVVVPVVAVGSIVRHFDVPKTDAEYVASRSTDAAKLFSQMKWESAGGSGRVVKCEIYNIVLWRCFMHYDASDLNISVKNNKADPMAPYLAEFKTEAQMLAWILRNYW